MTMSVSRLPLSCRYPLSIHSSQPGHGVGWSNLHRSLTMSDPDWHLELAFLTLVALALGGAVYPIKNSDVAQGSKSLSEIQLYPRT